MREFTTQLIIYLWIIYIETVQKTTVTAYDETLGVYFGCKVGDQDKRWTPHICCVGCSSSLSAWYKGTGSGLTFGVPMIWRQPLDHSTDCYFCPTDIQGLLTHLYSKEIVIQLLYC